MCAAGGGARCQRCLIVREETPRLLIRDETPLVLMQCVRLAAALDAAGSQVLALEKGLAELVNAQRVWEAERVDMQDAMARIESKYQEERQGLEAKV